MKSIYLDNNSTTVIDPDVANDICECMSSGFVNPASQHQLGQRTRRRLEEIRSNITDMLGARSSGMNRDHLIFTSGGTESNNLAISGLAFEPDGSLPVHKRILISSIEHPSVSAVATYLATLGFEVKQIKVTSNGVVDIDHLDELLKQPARMVSVMAVNHETGAIQPLRQISEICRRHNVLFHTDAVQAIGKIPISFSEIGADALTFTAHKLHGPKGIGGLLLRNPLKLFPRLFGGFQQQSYRPGTEDVCLAVGMESAIKKYRRQNRDETNSIADLRDFMENKLAENTLVTINSESADRVAHVSNIALSEVNRQEFLMSADMNGLAISTGSACASGSSDPSPVLLSMGLSKAIVESSIRISLSAFTTTADIEQATDHIIRISNNLRRSKSAR